MTGRLRQCTRVNRQAATVVAASEAVTRMAMAIAVLVLAGGCKKPPVTHIEIVPSRVTVGSDLTNPTTFELEARLWTGSVTDRLSITESQGYDNLQWKVSQPWLTVVSRTGFRAVLRVEAGAAPAVPGFVTVKAGGKTTEPGAEISVVPSGIGGQDVLTAKYTPAQPPNVVVVNGVRDGGTCSVTLSAFVTRLSLGAVKPCVGDGAGWAAALLSVDRGVAFTPPWTSNPDPVNAAPLQGSARSLPVALRVMVGSASLDLSEVPTLQNDVLEIAKADIAATNSLLAEARSGITLTIQNAKKISVAPTTVNDCLSGDEVTSSEDLAGVLNVYYVNALGGYRGLTCDRREGRNHAVIYVGWDQHSPTTFIHEVGHALGLTLPGAGHTDRVTGLDVTNVMAGGDDDRDPGGRRRLSVGQVFRMVVDSASWLSWATTNPTRDGAAPRLGCQCGAADPTGRCLRVVDDVASPSHVPGTASEWDCADQLWLRNVVDDAVVDDDDESPVAIVAGRRWRAPPGSCSTDLPGRTERHWGATYIMFDNLTRPGPTCSSWAAIFFRRHGVMYRKLAEPVFTWTQTADLLQERDALLDLIEVKVHVHSPPADLDQDVAHALETFGPSNRSGIKLIFPPTGTCPTTNASLDIYLCYVATGPNEAVILPDRIIKVSLDKRQASTASHFIGRALGLTAGNFAGAAFADNIMQSSPVKRGKKLTLGQVYRISVPRTSLPSCDPGPCPSLGADVPP